jgi:uncharacterized protein YdhG (YjbR/CyaY superfamily)
MGVAGKDEKVTSEERAALREWKREKNRSGKTTPEQDAAEVLAKIAEMPQPDRSIAERIHALVLAAGPKLAPRTWYGMPAYALDGKVLCFFQPASKFKARYGTLGFSDKAKLDEGSMWASSFAITKVDAEVEATITTLVKRAVG